MAKTPVMRIPLDDATKTAVAAQRLNDLIIAFEELYMRALDVTLTKPNGFPELEKTIDKVVVRVERYKEVK